MRGEYEPAVRAEQKPVDLGDGKPLEVDDVRGPGKHAAHREGVLQRLERQPDGAPPGSDRPWIEAFHESVAVGSGPFAEAETRRDELDVGAGARERGRELVVVRRSEGRGVGEDDAHGLQEADGTRSLGPCGSSSGPGTCSTATPTRRGERASSAA